MAAMDNLSQELKGKPPEHLSETTLEQLTTLGNILKRNIEDEDEQQKIAQKNRTHSKIRDVHPGYPKCGRTSLDVECLGHTDFLNHSCCFDRL